MSARAGGLRDICAAQIQALHEHGLDVHLAMPNYRLYARVLDRSLVHLKAAPGQSDSSQIAA
jgi:glycogen synthase